MLICETSNTKTEDLISVLKIQDDAKREYYDKLSNCYSQYDLRCNEVFSLNQTIIAL